MNDYKISLIEYLKWIDDKINNLDDKIKANFDALYDFESVNWVDDDKQLRIIREQYMKKVYDLFFIKKKGHLQLSRNMGSSTYIRLFAHSLILAGQKVCIISTKHYDYESYFSVYDNIKICYYSNTKFDEFDFSEFNFVLIDSVKGYDFYNEIKHKVELYNEYIYVFSLSSYLEILD